MLSFEEGVEAVRFARAIVDAIVKHQPVPEVKLSEKFKQKNGAFVTLLTFPSRDLRGCIGIPEPIMRLKDAIKEAASSATRDPRFPPVDKRELNSAEVIASANMIPLALDGKALSNLLAITLCRPIFSTAIANINPPKNKNIIDLE